MKKMKKMKVRERAENLEYYVYDVYDNDSPQFDQEWNRLQNKFKDDLFTEWKVTNENREIAEKCFKIAEKSSKNYETYHLDIEETFGEIMVMLSNLFKFEKTE